MFRRKISKHTLSEIVRLSAQGLSDRQIARSVRLSRTTVRRYLERTRAAGISCPLPPGMTEAKLLELVTPKSLSPEREEPDFAAVHRELSSRRFATLELLWTEQWIGVMSYQTFCRRYKAWKEKLKLSMRKHYRGGEALFIDFAGDTLPVTDPSTGEVRDAHIFVAVLGASNYTFVEAVWNEDLESWVALVVKALEFIGGVPELVISDNAKAVVTKADRYDPQLHHLFIELSRHYGFALLPARPRKPKDKAKVEAGVKHIYHGIFGKLEKRTFLGLDDLNQSINKELSGWNEKPFQKLAGSRKQLFDEIDRPALKQLPLDRFEFAQWRKAKVHIDYHVQVDKHFYSVPHSLISKEVDVRLTKSTVEIFLSGDRIASHQRSISPGRFTTLEEHMPMHQRNYVDQNSEYFLSEASKLGPWCARFVEGVFERRKYPQLGFRTCQGLLRLSKRYGPERIEIACEKAVRMGGFAYRTLESLLVHRLDQFERAPAKEQKVVHLNIRGAEYYSEKEEEQNDADTSNNGKTKNSQTERHA